MIKNKSYFYVGIFLIVILLYLIISEREFDVIYITILLATINLMLGLVE